MVLLGVYLRKDSTLLDKLPDSFTLQETYATGEPEGMNNNAVRHLIYNVNNLFIK